VHFKNKGIFQVVEHEDNETWLTIPQNKSPLARKTNGKATQRPEVEPPTGSPSRYHLLSNELEEGEVDVEEDSSDEESSVESQTALEKKKQMERQKSGKKKKSQKVNPNINVGLRKDQNKGSLQQLSAGAFEVVAEATTNWNYWAEIEENFLRQKSRITWLKNGDQNTLFFFKIVQCRSSFNLIRQLILPSGETITDPQLIKIT
ncbi:hypothetical protein IGI04_007304, partial [Brassica rapa subsp. trilocularis]